MLYFTGSNLGTPPTRLGCFPSPDRLFEDYLSRCELAFFFRDDGTRSTFFRNLGIGLRTRAGPHRLRHYRTSPLDSNPVGIRVLSRVKVYLNWNADGAIQ